MRPSTHVVATLATALLGAALTLSPAPASATVAGTSGTAIGWSNFDSRNQLWAASGVTAIAVGDNHLLTLDADGRVSQLGYSGSNVPENARNIIAIDAAGDASLALRSDGVVIGWGSYYETAAPRGLSGVQAIAVGPSMGAALKFDGTVETWGLTDYGQHEFAVGLTGATAIDVGRYHALAVTAAGTVVGSGGPTGDSAAAHPPKGLTGVRTVAAGESHSLALKTDGTVVAWGSNTYGESTVPVGLSGITAIAAGRNQSFAINASGQIISWGRAGAGTPAVPAGLTNVTAISAGPFYAAAITTSAVPTVPASVSVDARRNPPTVSWRPPSYSGATSVTGYRVTASPGGFAARLSRFARSYQLPRRTDAKPYVVSVAAINSDGTGAAQSVRVAKNDIRTFNPVNAQWLHPGQQPILFGRPGDKPAAGDYNGDGAVELAVFRPSTGFWIIRGKTPIKFGQAGDIPVPADYNGDGRTDIALYRPSTGVWYVKGFANVQLGARGDIPVPADYTGDGLADLTVFRPGNGRWYRHLEGRTAPVVVRFGQRGDLPTPGDYNNDGVAEYSFYRPSNGTWQPGSGKGVRFGTRGDVPVPGDYNSDGRTDFALFRPSNATWYVRSGVTLKLGGRGVIAIAPPLKARSHG